MNAIHSFITRHRDLTCVRLDGDRTLVVACDSVGGIGMKQHDSVQAAPELVGQFALRVPLMEVVAAGADPFLIVDALSIEGGPYSRAILAGMRSLAATVGLDDPRHFNGSTEDNVVTTQTGVGVTVLGLARNEQLWIGSSRPEDIVVVAGLPKSAPEHDVRPDDPDILMLADLLVLRAHTAVRDIVPVGSKGIGHEMRQLATSAQLQYVIESDSIALDASGGPSTCVVFSCAPDGLEALSHIIAAPMNRVGVLRRVN